MPPLTFTLFTKPHGNGHEVHFVRDEAGRERRASAEEAALWARVWELEQQVAALSADEHAPRKARSR